MNVKGRLERLEREGFADAPLRFRVIVPRKMTREEWAAHVRAMPRDVFTVDLDGARREAAGE